MLKHHATLKLAMLGFLVAAAILAFLGYVLHEIDFSTWDYNLLNRESSEPVDDTDISI